MANISIFQSQRKAKKFIPIIIGVVLLGGVMLLIVLQGGIQGQEVFEGTESSSALLRSQVQQIKSGVVLPEGFFGDGVLGQFIPYDPIQAPAEWGRENPFSPFNPEDIVVEEAPTGGTEEIE